MSTTKKERDEILEALWSMRERGVCGLDDLKAVVEGEFEENGLDDLKAGGLVRIDADCITLTEAGERRARPLIRAHRIGERLIHDVLGGDYEAGACELEHIIDTGLVDSICTLLGHPRHCPHGREIPPGDCCRRSEKVAYSPVIMLNELEVGESAKVAYVTSSNDREMHLIDSLQIKPGTMITMHQKHPSIVIRCEGAHIALDSEMAENIRMWGRPKQGRFEGHGRHGSHGEHGTRGGHGRKRRRS